MITFNDTLDTAVACIRKWNKNTLVKEATLIRDVYGKVSLLMDNTEPVDDSDKGTLSSVLSAVIWEHISAVEFIGKNQRITAKDWKSGKKS